MSLYLSICSLLWTRFSSSSSIARLLLCLSVFLTVCLRIDISMVCNTCVYLCASIYLCTWVRRLSNMRILFISLFVWVPVCMYSPALVFMSMWSYLCVSALVCIRGPGTICIDLLFAWAIHLVCRLAYGEFAWHLTEGEEWTETRKLAGNAHSTKRDYYDRWEDNQKQRYVPHVVAPS